MSDHVIDKGCTESSGHLPDDAAALAEKALEVLARAHDRGLSIATAESCTGGLLSSLLTDQEGYGHCFERGFVVYTEAAKADLLGLEPAFIERHGAVSGPVAAAMAQNTLARSQADIAVSITGFAGPAGPGDEVGLVYLACAAGDDPPVLRQGRYGQIGRERVRNLAVRCALEMLDEGITRMRRP